MQCACLGPARESVALAHSAAPADAILIGQTLLALGFAEWKAGVKDGPDQEMRESIEIAEAKAYTALSVSSNDLALDSKTVGLAAREDV